MKENTINWKHAVFVFLIILILRLPSLWTPILDVDESQFAGFAHSILKGGIPYIDSLDTKPLGTYYFFAAIFLIFGINNMFAVHLITIIWVALTALFCFRIAKKLYSSRAGLIAALLYGIFTTVYIPKFISTSIVILMMLPLTMSIDMFLLWEHNKKEKYIWLSGILWGIACLFKYQAGINLILMAFYLLFFRPLYLERDITKFNFRAFLIYLTGGAIVGGMLAIHLVIIGAWDAFSFWSLHGSLAYVEAANTLTHFWENLVTRGGAMVASCFLLFYFALRRTSHLFIDFFKPIQHKQSTCDEYLLLFWLLLSIIPVCTGGKFYGHYFLQIFPALAILASGSVIRFFNWIAREPVTYSKKLAYTLFTIALLLPPIVAFGARLYSDQIYKAVGEENPKTYIEPANYIKANSNKDDTIFVWGFSTPIYTFANRLSASRFLWCDWLTGRVSGTSSAKDAFFDTTLYITKGSWELLFKDLEKNKPVYFIDTTPGNHHDYGKYPMDKYPNLLEYVNKNFHYETSINKINIYRRNDS